MCVYVCVIAHADGGIRGARGPRRGPLTHDPTHDPALKSKESLRRREQAQGREQLVEGCEELEGTSHDPAQSRSAVVCRAAASTRARAWRPRPRGGGGGGTSHEHAADVCVCFKAQRPRTSDRTPQSRWCPHD